MTDKLNSDIVVAKLFGEMNSTSLELSFKSHFVCLYMYVCNHVRMLIVQINMFKPNSPHLFSVFCQSLYDVIVLS